jgi:ribosomal protein S18 acetylase RimI-like enzyme
VIDIDNDIDTSGGPRARPAKLASGSQPLSAPGSPPGWPPGAAAEVPRSAVWAPRTRPARRSELPRTAALHARHLPDGFFAKLGPGFLAHYHRTFRRSPDAVLLVVGRPGAPTGFLAGTLDNEAHYRWVARRATAGLAARGALALVARPRLLAGFLRTRVPRYAAWFARRVREPRRAGRRPVRPHARPSASQAREPGASATVAVLTHVAVDPRARGRGSGRELVQSFVERARGAGAREVRLVTDRTAAAAFYRTLGWRSHGSRRGSAGTVVEEFRIPLEGGPHLSDAPPVTGPATATPSTSVRPPADVHARAGARGVRS